MSDNSQQFPLFVVSLKKDSERRAFMAKQLKEMGLSFTFFDAIDCRQGIPDQYKDRCDHKLAYKRIGRKMLDGEWGCALSHALLYEKIVNEQIEHAIILEDDVVLSDDFKELVTTCHLKQAKKGLVLLYTNSYRRYIYTFRWLRPQPVFAYYRLYRTAYPLESTCAYYLNFAMAHKLHKATKTLSFVADWPIDVIPHTQLLLPFTVTAADHQFVSHLSQLRMSTKTERGTAIKRPSIYKRFRLKLYPIKRSILYREIKIDNLEWGGG